MLCSHRLLWISSRRTVVSNQNKIHYVYRMAEIFSAVFFYPTPTGVKAPFSYEGALAPVKLWINLTKFSRSIKFPLNKSRFIENRSTYLAYIDV